MKKSTLIMILCLVLAVAIGVGSTLAYLTDTDADKNVMTVGRVSVVQNEQQRVEENGEFTDELEPFVNDKMLLPVTDRNGTADNVTIGDHELELKDKYNNYIDKIVTATNTSNVDVYLRTFVALPTGIYEGSEHWHEYDAAADVWLHWNLVDDVYTHYDLVEVTGGDFYITVDGVEYEVWQFTHKAPVAPEETTYPVIRGLFMDKRVDMDEEGYYITLDDGTVHRIGNFLDEDGKMNVLVLTQAVQADGFDSADSALTQAFPYGEDNANVEKWFTDWTEDDIGSPGDKNDTNNPPAQFTGDPQELATLLSEATDAQSGDVTIELTDNYDMSGYDWTPISVDGYHGAGIVTVKGNGHTIKNLNAPLFAGGFAGKSGIVIEDLTIADSTMTAPTDQGSGAFICCADSMTTITLDNCHAKNVTLNGASRTGGLVGWTSGYSRQDDGPVKSYVTLKDCTVEGCTINAETESAGGLIGHSGASDWTFTTVTNCSVIDTEINGGNGKTGVYVGTANVGETTLTGCSYEDVTGNVNTEHPEYGRFVPGTTGKLTIDGNEI